MTRLITPIVKITIVILVLVLAISLFLVFVTPAHRLAESSRRKAISTLYDADGSLGDAISFLAEPYMKNGSIADLQHYLSKNPGRENFIRASDRQYAQTYLEPLSSTIDLYKKAYTEYEMDWTPTFLATTRTLFEQIKYDILNLTGISDFSNFSKTSPISEEFAGEQLREVIEKFSVLWIPFGETHQTYRMNRKQIRNYLIKSRRFKKFMKNFDKAWRSLSVALYNLSMNPNWHTAVSFDPSLKSELDDLIIIVLSGDNYWRGKDIMANIPDINQTDITQKSPGIRWNPEFTFYKNIPELTGQTKDEIPTFFFVKINIGYTAQDVRTQTWLNRNKDWIMDYFKSYFSNLESKDISSFLGNDTSLAEWKMAIFKAKLIHSINNKIILEHRFGSLKVFGIRELAIIRIQLIEDK